MSNEELNARLTLLESFIGNINDIALYANSIQEVVDKYLSPLYIEDGSLVTDTSVLTVSGYLGPTDAIPRNILLKIRPSHTFKVGASSATIVFKRGETSATFPLKKLTQSEGGLVTTDLTDNNYLAGIIYDVYINSQGIAIISSNDSGVQALSQCAELATDIVDNANAITGMTTALSTQNLTATKSTISEATVTTLKVTNAVDLPAGCTVKEPTAVGHPASKGYVDSTIAAEIKEFFEEYFSFGSGDANTALASKPNGSIYHKYE